MIDVSQLKDKTLRCVDCGAPFVFSAGEQAYFTSKEIPPPKRCKACRQHRKATLVRDPDRGVRDER